MGMGMILRCECAVRHDLLGGATESIFVLTESFIFSSSKNQAGLELLEEKVGKGFESVMDMLFCFIFPEFRSLCFKFYRDRESPLREILSVEQIQTMDAVMLSNLRSMKTEDWEIISDLAA